LKSKTLKCVSCGNSQFQCSSSRRNEQKERNDYVCSACKTLQAIDTKYLSRSLLIESDQSNLKFEKYVCGGDGYILHETAKRVCDSCGELKIRGTSIFNQCWSCIHKHMSKFEFDQTYSLSIELRQYQKIHSEWLSKVRQQWQTSRMISDSGNQFANWNSWGEIDPNLPMFDPSRKEAKRNGKIVLFTIFRSDDIINLICVFL
jgi:hypothetical protein